MEAKIKGGVTKGKGQKYKVFHKMTNVQHRRNLTGRFWVNGEWVMEDVEIQEKVVNYFHLQLSNSMGKWRLNIYGMPFKKLSNENSCRSEEVFTEKKIHDALIDLNRDKALRPNGFSLTFWQHCGDFV